MGETDKDVVPIQIEFLKTIRKKFFETNNFTIKKIAFLGEQTTSPLIKAIIGGKFVGEYYCGMFHNAEHDFYDIQMNNWDINKEWNVSGYDLVTCFRVSMFVENKKMFLQGLKKTIETNKHVVVDFTMRMTDDKLNCPFDFRSLFNKKILEILMEKGAIDNVDDNIQRDAVKYKELIEEVREPTYYCLEVVADKKDLMVYMYWKGDLNG